MSKWNYISKKGSFDKKKWQHAYIAGRRHELRERINRLKTAPCVDCGVQYNPWVMQFDHRDPATKKFSISQRMCGNTAWGRMEAEIAKCDLVCANCHAERTHTQLKAGTLTPGKTVCRI